jgi:CPA1 family monovalent cation:H+ antiporter
LTLALVFGGYSLAEALHVSAPIAAVVSGLIIGNKGRAQGMSDVTRDHLDKFWALIDEVLNAVLFVLMGFEIIHMAFHASIVVLGIVAIPIVLAARVSSVALPILVLRRFVSFVPGALWMLTWGGLRGGISVALALSLPASPNREAIVVITYVVVLFSVLVQGLTLAPLARRLQRS